VKQAKANTSGWSSDGALLMKRGEGERGRADKTDPWCQVPAND